MPSPLTTTVLVVAFLLLAAGVPAGAIVLGAIALALESLLFYMAGQS